MPGKPVTLKEQAEIIRLLDTGLTQEEVSRRTGRSTATIRAVKRGRPEQPETVASMKPEELAERLGLSGGRKVLAPVLHRALMEGSTREQVDALRLVIQAAGDSHEDRTQLEAAIEQAAAQYHAVMEALARIGVTHVPGAYKVRGGSLAQYDRGGGGSGGSMPEGSMQTEEGVNAHVPSDKVSAGTDQVPSLEPMKDLSDVLGGL